VLVGLGVVATLLVVLLIVAGWVLSRIGLPLDGLDIGIKPIPVPATACPSLRLVHDDAARATAVWNPVWSGTETPSQAREFWVEMGPILERLDQSLHRALPRVPAPIAAQFRVSIRDVEVGQAALLYFRDPHRYMSATFSQLFEGSDALWQASQLVGNACGFDLWDVPNPPPRASA
jgi:hypothetical protein